MVKYSEVYDDLNPWRSSTMGNVGWANAYLGAPTSPFEINQLQQIMRLVPSGIQNVEVGTLKAEDFETIPKQHFKQMKQLAKLTIKDFEKEGRPSPLSVHAPMIEPAGFSENKWNEDVWKQNQEQLKNVVEKAADLGTRVPVTIHGSGQVSNVFRVDERGREYHDIMAVVDPENGQVQFAKREKVQYPWGEELETPEKRLNMMNHTFWVTQKREIAAAEVELDRIEQRFMQETGKRPREIKTEDERDALEPRAANLYDAFNIIKNNLDNQIITTFDKAYKAAKIEGDKEQLHILGLARQIGSGATEESKKVARNVALELIHKAKFEPDVFIPVENFAREKASETFANLAMHSIKTAKDKGIPSEQAPVICIENWTPDAAFGRGESMRALIEESRKKFVGKAVASGMSSPEAGRLAEKLIGATWDVGHINILKKYGYDKEQWKEELEKIKKDVKHVHLTDNFGYHDAHLPPGMGNVPVIETMKELEKAGKLGEIKAIVEAGAYVKAFKDIPTMQTLQYMASPLYPWQANPHWGEIGENYFFGSASYAPGYGTFLPPEHFSMYGAGFSQLPTALGGVKGGEEKSKFAGTPMA